MFVQSFILSNFIVCVCLFNIFFSQFYIRYSCVVCLVFSSFNCIYHIQLCVCVFSLLFSQFYIIVVEYTCEAFVFCQFYIVQNCSARLFIINVFFSISCRMCVCSLFSSLILYHILCDHVVCGLFFYQFYISQLRKRDSVCVCMSVCSCHQ